jgi:ABC-type nitrate/sulfonate/bicarbonate transport system permease component
MTDTAITDLPEDNAARRKWIVHAGRLLVAVAIIAAWEYGARSLGPLFFAPPLDVLKRLGAMAQSGQMLADIAATLRVSVVGFAIAAVFGVLIPFLLRHSRRATDAIEPYIMASMGIPKYALAPWLILWFGIGDLPKLVVVASVVFYILFITTFAGIRGVDQRLINMARVIGASERVIAREIIWTSLLPFFFTGLKIAFPRAVSATIVGEFLVSTQGVGRSIEQARQIADTTGVFAGVVVAIALVLAINGMVNLIERWALRWRPLEREMEL